MEKRRTPFLLIVSFFIVISGCISFINRNFIHFSSPESAFQAFEKDTPVFRIQGKQSACVFGNNAACYVVKDDKGWKYPETQGINQFRFETNYNLSVACNNPLNTEDYYIIVIDVHSTKLEVSNNRGSKFSCFTRTTGVMESEEYVTYVTCLNDIDDKYVVYVNGEAYKYEVEK